MNFLVVLVVLAALPPSYASPKAMLAYEPSMACVVCRRLVEALHDAALSPDHAPREDSTSREYVTFMTSPDRHAAILATATEVASSSCYLFLGEKKGYRSVPCEEAKAVIGSKDALVHSPDGVEKKVAELLARDTATVAAVDELLSQEYTVAEMDWTMCVEREAACDGHRSAEL